MMLKPETCHFFLIAFSYILLTRAAVLRELNEDNIYTCGYEGCPKIDPNKLNVHLVAHTHDDVGWINTIDQYYYGISVRRIIDSVVESLRKDPKRRFIYVETAFLWKWWEMQNEETRKDVRTFITEGRLEIISGAWSMNDEATTHYQSIVDQFTWGFRRLNDTFGECARPKIGWQIDPFGHSREQASLFAQFGFDGMFFGRLDFEDKDKRLNNKTTEFVWKASSSLGEKADLLSVALFNKYGPPPGFCFDILCHDSPMIDDPNGLENNIEYKVSTFLQFCRKQAKSYNTNNIILTMGEDFNYQNAEKWFSNLDKLIKYSNQIYGSEINVFYSSPSCYIKSLHDANKTWTTKTDDFFPYSSGPNSFWTGYFTSRPTLKYFERMGNNFLQVTKQLSVLSKKMDSPELQHFREVMGVMQHHDAVTGTEKQYVAEDYARILHESIAKNSDLVSSAIAELSIRGKIPAPEKPTFHSCLLLNESSCAFSENSKSFVVTLYNPRSHPSSTYVRIPVQGKGYIVNDSNDIEIVTQLIPIPRTVLQMPGRMSKATRELVFRALEIPPFGYKSFFIKGKEFHIDEVNQPLQNSSIGNEFHEISVNGAGEIVIQWKKENISVTQSFKYYKSDGGDDYDLPIQASGAYIFRPKDSKIYNFVYAVSYQSFKGPLVEELHVIVNEFISIVVRIYIGEDRVEFEWIAGPIPVKDWIGKEIVILYSSKMQSNGVFYTDSNGREMLKRVRNFRATWDLHLEEPIAGNYYPVTAKISLQDEKAGLKVSILNDRAQGGTSMKDGEIEIMVHRRLLNDDGFGVGEALNERAFGTGLVARGVHYLVGSNLKNPDSVVLKEKSLALQLALRPWILFTPLKNEITFSEWKNTYVMEFEGLRKRLPPNIHILTYEPWKDGTILMRLEHLFEIGEGAQLSQPVEINISDLFADFDITSVRETSLGGNQWIEDMNRLKWKTNSSEIHRDFMNVTKHVENQNGIINVLLKPMEIRTFIITGLKNVLK